jgi:hypothetical protein
MAGNKAAMSKALDFETIAVKPHVYLYPRVLMVVTRLQVI